VGIKYLAKSAGNSGKRFADKSHSAALIMKIRIIKKNTPKVLLVGTTEKIENQRTLLQKVSAIVEESRRNIEEQKERECRMVFK
jgi:hypothetical protein